MRKGKYSDEQVIAILREHEAGRRTVQICRKDDVSNATFYKWKSKFGGMEVSDAKRLKALEDEKRRELGDRDERVFAAPRLPPDRVGPEGLPAAAHAASSRRRWYELANDLGHSLGAVHKTAVLAGYLRTQPGRSLFVLSIDGRPASHESRSS